MAKKDLVKFIEIEYDDDCFWRVVALSTNPVAIQFRLKNSHIDFRRCRNNCPIYDDEKHCCCYFPLSQKLNLVPELQ
jgi:hypothetical protein